MRISDWSSDVCSSDLLRRQRRGAGGREAHGVQSELANQLAFQRPSEQRNLQQAIEFPLRQFGEHRLLEFDPQPWHRKEHGRTRTLQITRKRIQRFGAVDAKDVIKRIAERKSTS